VILAKTRITITPAEYRLLSPGLECLANGLASAKLGSFPHRHPYHGVDFLASAVYEKKAFDLDMAERIVSTRGALHGLKASRKVRFDSFQFAVAAMALRVARKLCQKQSGVYPATEAKVLGAKIERFRKRARREGIGQFGKVAYSGLAFQWTAFVQWVRYNLLHFAPPSRVGYPTMKLWKQQRTQLEKMIVDSVAERFRGPLTPPQLSRMTLLAKESFRRGRESIGLRVLLESGGVGRELLFGFVEPRVVLAYLPGSVKPPWLLQTEAGEKFNAYLESKRNGTWVPRHKEV
jgi:hypothetical protein